MTEVVGLTYEAALKLTDERKLSMRIYRMDGHARICTRDLKVNRVNVNVENGFVVDAHLG